MARFWRWITRRARESPNLYAILVGVLLTFAVPMYVVRIAVQAHNLTGVPAIDAIRQVAYPALDLAVQVVWIPAAVGVPLIFLGAMRALKPTA